MFEERALHPADQALDTPFLIAAARRAHFDADANVDDRLRKRCVEFFDRAAFAAFLHDRLRPIKYSHERQPTEGDEIACQATHEGLDALVFNEGDLRESRVLQS